VKWIFGQAVWFSDNQQDADMVKYLTLPRNTGVTSVKIIPVLCALPQWGKHTTFQVLN